MLTWILSCPIMGAHRGVIWDLVFCIAELQIHILLSLALCINRRALIVAERGKVLYGLWHYGIVEGECKATEGLSFHL